MSKNGRDTLEGMSNYRRHCKECCNDCMRCSCDCDLTVLLLPADLCLPVGLQWHTRPCNTKCKRNVFLYEKNERCKPSCDTLRMWSQHPWCMCPCHSNESAASVLASVPEISIGSVAVDLVLNRSVSDLMMSPVPVSSSYLDQSCRLELVQWAIHLDQRYLSASSYSSSTPGLIDTDLQRSQNVCVGWSEA